jgi:translation initiation factor IF-3
MQHPEVARALLERVSKDVADVTLVESMPLLDGSSMVMVLAPAHS